MWAIICDAKSDLVGGNVVKNSKMGYPWEWGIPPSQRLELLKVDLETLAQNTPPSRLELLMVDLETSV